MHLKHDGISPNYVQSEVNHFVKNRSFGIPLILTLSVTDKLTCANVYEQICNLLEHCVKYPTEEDMDEDFNEGDKLFHITYRKRGKYKSDRNLIPSEEIFDMHCQCKIIFTVQWKNLRYWNTKMFLEFEKDKSFPSEEVAESSKAIPLSSCLDAFTKEEVLTKDNGWYCSKCEEIQVASKKIDLWRLPDLLIIHLKRFSSDPISRQKINSLVNFPLKNLDLKNWVPPNCRLTQSTTYDLYGASMHSGTMQEGHYTAYVQSLESGDWYHMNDQFAISANGEKVQSPEAYLLFYKRKN